MILLFSRHPEVKWAEREDKVYLTVQLSDAKNPKVNLDPEGFFTFSACAGTDNNLYELKRDLIDKVNAEGLAMVMHENNEVHAVFEMLQKALEVAHRDNRVADEQNISILVAQMHVVKGNVASVNVHTSSGKPGLMECIFQASDGTFK